MNATLIHVSKVVGLVSILVASVGCDNYTYAPVCTDANAAFPHGISGNYSWSIQKDDFSIETRELRIDVTAGGSMKVQGDGDEDESRICQAGGYLIQETFNDVIHGYVQQRLYITGMGLTFSPVFYNKPRLDDAGVPTKVVVIPDESRKFLGKSLADAAEKSLTRLATLFNGSERLGLLINNTGMDANVLMSYTEVAPVGATLLRR